MTAGPEEPYVSECVVVKTVENAGASALFDRIDVLGITEATVYLSAHAIRHGLGAALPAELGILVSGRGERI